MVFFSISLKHTKFPGFGLVDNYFEDEKRQMKIPSPGINLQFRLDMEMSGADSGGTNGLSFFMRGSRKNGARADPGKEDPPGMSVSTSA